MMMIIIRSAQYEYIDKSADGVNRDKRREMTDVCLVVDVLTYFITPVPIRSI